MPQITIAILIAGLLPIACAGLAKWGFKDYNNREPRTWLAAQEGWRARANAAQQNSFEIFPLFVAAVIFAILAGTDASIISPLCWFFVATRIIYTHSALQWESPARFARQALEKATLVVKPESEISTSGRD